jgi:hypothetical protein
MLKFEFIKYLRIVVTHFGQCVDIELYLSEASVVTRRTFERKCGRCHICYKTICYWIRRACQRCHKVRISDIMSGVKG